MKTKLILFFASLCSLPLLGQDSLSMEQMAPLPSNGRDDASGFAINGAGFIGLGSMGVNGGFAILNDLWKYDPISNSWIEKEALPAAARQYAMSFSFENEGYVFGGHNSNTYFNEMWKYNENQAWLLTDSLPNGARAAGALFVIDNFLYFGTGRDADNYYQDFWKYDLVNKQWTALDPFPGGLRFETVGYALNGLGYLGLGRNESFDFKNDIWMFDPSSEEWFGPCFLSDSLGYSKSEVIENSALFFGGQQPDLTYSNSAFALDETCDEYKQNHTEIPRRGCTSFAIDDAAYFFGGLLGDNIKTNELVKIVVDEDTGLDPEIVILQNENTLQLNASEIIESLSVYDLNGKLLSSHLPRSYMFEIELNRAAQGIYLIAYSTKNFSGSAKVLIHKD